MSTYQPDQLLQLWKSEQIDSQMVIGHLLQNLVLQDKAIAKMNSSLIRLKVDVDNLVHQTESQTSKSSHRKET